MICPISMIPPSPLPSQSPLQNPLPRLSQSRLPNGLSGAHEARARLFGFSARAYGAPCIGRYDSIVL